MISIFNVYINRPTRCTNSSNDLSLSALHVSDSLVHHQERRFGAVYRNWCKPVPLPDAPAYTNCDIQLQNVAPDDGLKSPKHVEHLMVNKEPLEEFVHLVDLPIYTLQYDSRYIQRQIQFLSL